MVALLEPVKVKTIDYEESDLGIRTYNVVLVATFDSGPVPPRTVLSFCGVTKFETYFNFFGESDPRAFASKAKVNQLDEMGNKFEVTYQFDNDAHGTGQVNQDGTQPSKPQDQGDTDPGEQTFFVSYGTEEEEVPFVEEYKDEAPKKVVSSAGQAFDPPVIVNRPASYIEIKFLCYNQTFANKCAYEGKVNSQSWTFNGFTYPAKTLFVKQLSFDIKWKMGFVYADCTLRLNYRADFFNPIKVLDQGTYQKPAGGNGSMFSDQPPQPIKSLTGEGSVSANFPLNGEGKPLTVAQIIAGEFVYLEFVGFYEVPFTNILRGL
ncbi:hypothetical protein [Limnoglobus roseus]|uniref:Uncharacterized protein n=1 Tax=Limnoglobus roseus TaxID=2598579 RepID=A0A5C1AEC7_9BACT|nr:hypothetical protein [Limnoglobus roseus]QEL16557.1 hypothetical protein PX52LOC_03517 [Limnoglobus roseus]